MRYWDSSLRKKNKSKEKMIRCWTISPKRKEKSKEKMIHYYIEIWEGKPLIKPHVLWPIFGSFEYWECQQLSIWVSSKRPPASPEEREYASMRIGSDTRTHLFPLKEKKKHKQELYLVLPWLLLYAVKVWCPVLCEVSYHLTLL